MTQYKLNEAKTMLVEVPKCKHNPILSEMGYLSAHAEAERRMKKGQKQKQCPTCKLWFFKDEYSTDNKTK